MRVLRKIGFLGLFIAMGSFAQLRSQILIPEELPLSGEIVFMQNKFNKLWVIQALPFQGKARGFSVSVKSGSRWDKLPTMFLSIQSLSNGIRFTDLEIFGNRIYVSGDFTIAGKSKNCLIYTETSAKEWFGDYEFSSINQTPPIVNGITTLETKMYIGGFFIKMNNGG